MVSRHKSLALFQAFTEQLIARLNATGYTEIRVVPDPLTLMYKAELRDPSQTYYSAHDWSPLAALEKAYAESTKPKDKP